MKKERNTFVILFFHRIHMHWLNESQDVSQHPYFFLLLLFLFHVYFVIISNLSIPPKALLLSYT